MYPGHPLVFSRLDGAVVAVDNDIAVIYHQDFQERINDDFERLDQLGRYGKTPP